MAHRLVDLLRSIYGQDAIPRPFELLEIAQGIAQEPSSQKQSPAARKTIAAIQASTDPLHTALGLPLDFTFDPKDRRRVQTMIGQLLLGLLAERLFESIYKTELGTTELRLEDSREARNDTDYRVLNGQGRPVFRINIKFHGTLFRKAQEMVSLAPEDCFPLATYKIKQGLDKQENEVLPYLFVVVSGAISAPDVGALIPSDLIDLACYVHASKKISGKRKIEEKIVDRLANEVLPSFAPTLADLHSKLANATWRVLSARRANVLLREKLFERVYAVRVKGFTRSYGNAEVDMHFSLRDDMTPLREFLAQLGELGLHGIAGKLERGLL